MSSRPSTERALNIARSSKREWPIIEGKTPVPSRGPGVIIAAGYARPDEELMPYLVRFRDERQPLSVERIDPAKLESVFGEGVKLRSIAVQWTDEPVTVGRIEKLLPWYDPTALNRLANPVYKGEAVQSNIDWKAQPYSLSLKNYGYFSLKIGK